MKRLIALLLSLLLSMGAWSALAAEEIELPQKLLNQLDESGHMGVVSFSAEGDYTAAMDPAVWMLIKSLAPRLTLETGNSYIKRQQEGEGVMRLMLDGQNIGEIVYLYNNDLGAVSSTLLSNTENTYYAAPRDWDLNSILDLFSIQENGWPSLRNVLLKIENAPKEWHDKVAAHIIPYETKIGVWINGYALFSTGTENGVPYTQLACSIPAQAVKAQIKQLMIDFLGDDELLSALREILSPEEAAFYLQPGMLNTFFSAIDGVNLSGQIEIIRRYDVQGNSLLDSITLPFPEEMGVIALNVTLSPDEAGEKWTFKGVCRDNTEFDISCIQSEDMIFSGSVYLLLPEEGDDSFVVDDGSLSRREIAFDYNFSWDPGEDIFTLLTSRYSRTVRGTLLIRPKYAGTMPTQAITLEAIFESNADKRSSTRLNASLSWRDMDSNAAITASFTGRTTSPTAVLSLDDVPPALRLDLMEEEGMGALMDSWMQNLQAWAQNTLPKLFPVFSQPVLGDG